MGHKKGNRLAGRANKQSVHDEAVLDELSRHWSRGRVAGRRAETKSRARVHSGELEGGHSVEDHIRREWTSRQGGLPVF
jgi:hypothetical protein